MPAFCLKDPTRASNERPITITVQVGGGTTCQLVYTSSDSIEHDHANCVVALRKNPLLEEVT